MGLWQRLCRFVLFDLCGWHEQVTESIPPRCILAVAPHTSNWDFVVGELYYYAKGRRANFLMKKEWFVGPLGWLFRRMGGIPVVRSRHVHLTDQLAAEAQRRTHFQLAITPEGTRSAVAEWKKGFYYIALKANLPILLFAIDYHNRCIVCTKTILPNGDEEGQMQEIKQYYAAFKGKHPRKFAV